MAATNSLFTLLRCALGTARPEDAASLTTLTLKEWKDLSKIIVRQNITAFSFDGLLALLEQVSAQDLVAMQEDEDTWKKFFRKWGGQVLYQEQRFEEYVKSIGKLAQFFSENGSRMMVLKGYGLSLDWPTANHRPIGDIDIFLIKEGSKAQSANLNGPNASLGSRDLPPSRWGDRLVSEKLGIQVKSEDSHHSKFTFEGWSVENHHSFMEQDAYHSNRPFERELQQWIEEGREEIVINDVTLDIPAPSLMALHLTRHAGCDFASNTISVRQLLDWALFVNKRSAEVDWDRVTDIIDRMGMRGFLDLMNDLAVNMLGLSKEKFPPFKEDCKLRERAINDILFAPRVNEFPDHQRKFVYGLAKSRQAWRNRWKNRLVFNESFVSLYWQKATNRMRH